MDPAQWIAAFRLAHERSKRGGLEEREKREYLSMRDELARSLINAQGLTVPAKVPARRAFRVAQVFPIEINNITRTLTRDLSCMGFSCTVSGSFKEGEQIAFALTLGRNTEPIPGVARVITAPRQSQNATRLSANFEQLDEERLEKIESALFDAALARCNP